MNTELVFDRFGMKSAENIEEKVRLFKKVCNDSFFYFGIFLSAFFIMKLIPFLYGIIANIDFGINEVVVSLLGFANVFFMFLINKVFHKKTYDN
ncbi:MAG: hypothetical protein IPK06_15910 [Ignavibacteriae bacterium]|nr:hypothetical protein [Ignavibacteriota bacterium]